MAARNRGPSRESTKGLLPSAMAQGKQACSNGDGAGAAANGIAVAGAIPVATLLAAILGAPPAHARQDKLSLPS